MTARDQLSQRDLIAMDNLLRQVLDAHHAGRLSKEQAVKGLATIMEALDVGHVGEARQWFVQGIPKFQLEAPGSVGRG